MKVCALPVKTIAHYSKDGIPRPLRFAVEGSEDGEIVVKKIRVNSIEETKIRGEKVYKYVCQSIINDQLRVFEMRFFVSQCLWQLFKI